jgi:hypothetical protein
MPRYYPTHTKFKETMTDEICLLLARGNTYQCVCDSLGLGRQTFARWMQLGKQALVEGRDDDKYAVFVMRVRQACAVAEAYALESWRKHFDRDYRASRDFMARRYGTVWQDQRKLTVRVESEIGSMMTFLESRMEPDMFEIVVDTMRNIIEDRELAATGEEMDGDDIPPR